MSYAEMRPKPHRPGEKPVDYPTQPFGLRRQAAGGGEHVVVGIASLTRRCGDTANGLRDVMRLARRLLHRVGDLLRRHPLLLDGAGDRR